MSECGCEREGPVIAISNQYYGSALHRALADAVVKLAGITDPVREVRLREWWAEIDVLELNENGRRFARDGKAATRLVIVYCNSVKEHVCAS